MIAFLTSVDNLPFIIAVVLAFAVGTAELLTMVLGAGADFLGDLFPDLAPPDGPGGFDATGSLFQKALGFFYIGDVPLMMLTCLGLMSFGATGLIIQAIAQEKSGQLIAWWILIWPMFMVMLLGVRVGGSILKRIVPHDETHAISDDALVGLTGQLLQAAARQGSPAQALFKDKHGHPHYLLVQPDNPDTTFPPGSFVKTISHHRTIYTAVLIQNPTTSPTTSPSTADE